MSAEPQQGHPVDEWEPDVALPNLDVRGVIECQYAAIAAPSDDRVRACTRKIANGDSGLIKVRLGALSGLKPERARLAARRQRPELLQKRVFIPA